MPIDERWDGLSAENWTDFAGAWLAEIRSGAPAGEDSLGMRVVMMNFTARPEHEWKFILATVAHAQSDDELAHIAAGPIEHLLAGTVASS